ncbi:MAG: PAS domain S-box protein [Myxococcales bacterium]|nr:MAG: PAS domain S-box protein [Myxococcales bacterium]
MDKLGQGQASENQAKLLLGLILFRIVTITVLLGSTTILNLSTDNPWSPVQHIIFYSIGVTYLLSIFYLLAVKYNSNFHFQAVTQLIGDLLFWSCLIYVTGGLHSPFTFLYALSIIHGSLLLGRRGAYLAFGFSAFLFTVTVLFESSGIFHEMLRLKVSFNELWSLEVVYQFFLNSCMLLLIAILASSLATQIQSREEALTLQRLGLEMQRMLNRSIVAGISSGFVTIDLAGRVTFMNVAAERIAGISHDAARDHLLWELFPELKPALLRDLRGEQWARHAEIERKADGAASRWFTVTFADLLGASNRRVGSIIIIEDITARRKLEERVHLSEKLAAIGKLAAGIAHEIRNPLASISGSIQVLQRELPRGEDNEKLAEIVLRETERLNRLIDDFLSYARPRPLALGPVNIREIIEDITQLLTKVTAGDQTRIRVEYAPNVPELIADASQVRQILWNIIKNSLEASPSEKRSVVWISVKAAHADGAPKPSSILFEIRDNGEGMDKLTLEQIYDPFFTTKPTGTGLGMAIVYQSVMVHQGTIEVDSEIGRGTVFRIALPCRSPDDARVATN